MASIRTVAAYSAKYSALEGQVFSTRTFAAYSVL